MSDLTQSIVSSNIVPSDIVSSNIITQPTVIDTDTPKFPTIYSHPDDRKIFWICDYDMDKKLTSVLYTHGEKTVAYIDDTQYDNIVKDLIAEGWLRHEVPRVTVDFKRVENGEVEDSRVEDNRKESRQQRRADARLKEKKERLKRDPSHR